MAGIEPIASANLTAMPSISPLFYRAIMRVQDLLLQFGQCPVTAL